MRAILGNGMGLCNDLSGYSEPRWGWYDDLLPLKVSVLTVPDAQYYQL